MRAIKVMTGVWFFSLLFMYALFLLAHGQSVGKVIDVGGTLGYIVIFPVAVVALAGVPIVPLLWVVAFFLWLTRPAKPDFTPREIASRTPPAARYDAGHRWLG